MNRPTPGPTPGPNPDRQASACTARLLLIEDDRDQQELLEMTLSDQFGDGCVTIVGTLDDARLLDFDAFDLILTDYNLPDGTGMQMLQHIRSRSDVPVIMVTGENNDAYATLAIEEGAIDYVVKTPDYIDTVPLVVRKCLAMCKLNSRRAGEQAAAVDELKQQLASSEQRASLDPMTELYNRRAFEEVTGRVLAETERHGTPLAAVMLDMDRFKQLNDTLGHAVGDEAIKLAGKSIRRNLRQMDVAARYGGDEFVIFFPQTTAQTAATIMRRLRDEFWQESSDLLNHGMTMSIGIADLAGSGARTAEALMEAADRALYEAKHAGRDCIQGPGINLPRTTAA